MNFLVHQKNQVVINLFSNILINKVTVVGKKLKIKNKKKKNNKNLLYLSPESPYKECQLQNKECQLQ